MSIMNLSDQELEEYFNRVCDNDDWRAPIDTWIPEDDFTKTVMAVAHYTSTTLLAVERNDTGLIHVTADGYRNGPAGP